MCGLRACRREVWQGQALPGDMHRLILNHMNLARTTRMLPQPLQHGLESWLLRLLQPGGTANEDFLHPPGEPALVAADSISWTVFKNPLALFILSLIHI